eukprot:c9370_g1_i1.p1 GENE.c9370_g1_i1~~c9370_g1_i1.p1  ORF type:complete len:358 (+),score=65.43 c9370_g1_i1:3-1076(+)
MGARINPGHVPKLEKEEAHERELLTSPGEKSHAVQDVEAVAPNRTKHLLIQAGSFFGIVFQSTALSLFTTYAKHVRKEAWSSGSVLCATEVVKLLISLFAVARRWHATEILPFRQAIKKDFVHILPMTIPAVIYLCQNFMYFWAMARVDAATYQVCMQLKLVSTAIFSFFVLGRRFSGAQLRALAMIVLGVTTITLSTQPKEAATEEGNAKRAKYFTGLICMLVGVSLSGLSTVYMEKAFKDVSVSLTLWDRNLQLAICSIPIYLLLDEYGPEADDEPFFNGWTPLTGLIVVLNAVGGLLVAVCLKYADSIVKTLSVSGAIVVTSFLSYWVLNGPMDIFICIGALQTVLAVMSYQLA